jgi:hypothetical protein
MKVLKILVAVLEVMLETAGALLLQIWPVVLVLVTAAFFLVYTEQGIDVLASARGDAGEVFQLLLATFLLVAACALCTAHLMMVPPDWDRHQLLNAVRKEPSKDERAQRKVTAGFVAFIGMLIVLKFIIIDYVTVVEYDFWQYLTANWALAITYIVLLIVTVFSIGMSLWHDALRWVILWHRVDPRAARLCFLPGHARHGDRRRVHVVPAALLLVARDVPRVGPRQGPWAAILHRAAGLRGYVRRAGRLAMGRGLSGTADPLRRA